MRRVKLYLQNYILPVYTSFPTGEHCVGWPESMHDAQVFANSLLFRKITNRELLQGIGGRSIGGQGVMAPLKF